MQALLKQRRRKAIMITFLYGTYGSGKTTAILEQIARDTANGIHTFLLVPDQESVQAERKTLEYIPPSSQLSLEVLGFSRLYNRVCREYGGLSYQYVTKPIKSLLMWHNLRQLSPFLTQYGAAQKNDPSFWEVMLNAVGELKAAAVTAEDLEQAADALAHEEALSGRLRDLALISASFDRLVSENYSDAAEDLARLRDLLDQHSFFAGCHVYIDSFTSYTAVEHQIIERIFGQAESVTVTLPLCGPHDTDISTGGIRQSLAHLTRSAERKGGYREEILPHNQRARYPAIAMLAEHLWQPDVAKDSDIDGTDGSIVTEICDTPYAEAEAAASHIMTLLRSGARARDIVVIMRDAEQYRGIIEPALERSGIPFFFSEKSDLCATPPIKLILTALRLHEYNWRRADVIAHIKTGLCDGSDTDADLFEEYINTWNINGDRFWRAPFDMNPDGYSERMTPRGAAILEAANRVRSQVLEPLYAFLKRLEAAESVADMCRLLYRYLESIQLEDKLAAIAKKELERGAKKQAEETADLYGILLQTLADVAGALGEERLSVEELSQVLRIAFSQTTIGTIPTSIDEVTVGSASLLRVSDPKYALVLGLREGEFPATLKEKRLLSHTDRVLLANVGITLSESEDIRASDELMYVRRAFAAPSCRLYLFTSSTGISGEKASPSIPFSRAQKLFPSLCPHIYVGSDLQYLLPAPKNAVAHLRQLKGSSQGVALEEALEEFIPNVKAKSDLSTSEPSCTLDPSLIAERLGNHLKLSPTAFETYVGCPFQYACTYFLSLREKKQGEFRAADVGSFVHFILEKTVQDALSANEKEALPDGRTLMEATKKASREYVDIICPPEQRKSGRMRHLYGRLDELAYLLVRNVATEFRNSDFRPAFYELNINGKDGNPAPLALTLSDGSTVALSGKVDRVDVLGKDGEVYLRVVDYKTGAKSFRAEDAKKGLNSQMLFYLFSLCQSNSPEFRQAIGVSEDKQPLPAGVVYLSSALDPIDADDYETPEDTLAKAEASLKRSGLLLGEPDILEAMNHSLSPQFLVKGIKQKADGSLSEKSLASADELNDLCRELAGTIREIVGRMRSGCANAEPNEDADRSPCEFCQKKPICRKSANERRY